MPLTASQLMLFDMISDRILTLILAQKNVPKMTDEDCDVEIAKYEAMSDSEEDRMDSHTKPGQ